MCCVARWCLHRNLRFCWSGGRSGTIPTFPSSSRHGRSTWTREGRTARGAWRNVLACAGWTTALLRTPGVDIDFLPLHFPGPGGRTGPAPVTRWVTCYYMELHGSHIPLHDITCKWLHAITSHYTTLHDSDYMRLHPITRHYMHVISCNVMHGRIITWSLHGHYMHVISCNEHVILCNIM